jgi:hypothetical protein
MLTVNSGYVINDGNNGGNYSVTTGASTNGEIDRAALTITAAANTKVYDSTTSSAATPTVTGLQGSDFVTGLSESYATANAGTGLTLTVNGGYVIHDGNNGGNYTVMTVVSTGGQINPAALTITATANTKVYDGMTSATATPTVTGLQGSDTVSGLSESYTSANVGTGLMLTVNAGYLINDGNNGGNYTVTTIASTSGEIDPAALTLTALPESKVYGTSLTFGSGSTLFSSSGLQNGETIGSVTLAVSNNGGAPSAPVGSYTITPSAATGGTFNPSNYSISYGTGTLTVNQAGSSTALVSSVNPSVFGQSVTFTATVSANAPSSGTPTGTVTFLDGSTILGTGTLSGGLASFNTSALAVSSHSISASYGGDGNFTGSASASLSQTVNVDGTTTALVSSANPGLFGQSVTFMATVTANAPGSGMPTGTVIFLDGSTTLGTGTLNGGVASFSTSSLATGTHSITASYGASSSYAGSTSAVLSESIVIATTTTLSSSINPSTFGQSVTFTATVKASSGTTTPTGTVTFLDGNTTLGSATLSNGKATFKTSTLAAGSHTITASYGGSSTFGTSLSAPLSQTVNQSQTTTKVTSSVDPSVFGQSVTFTITVSAVSPGAGTPTGTVIIFAGGINEGSGKLTAGKLIFKSSAFPTGSSNVTVNYSGDTNFSGSTSPVLVQTVNKDATTTKVKSSLNPSVFGQSVTFTATVTANSPGSGLATGTVTFMDGSVTLGTGTLNSSGQATFTTSSLAVGNHSITAVYTGDNNFVTSTSTVLTQKVKAASAGVALPDNLNPFAAAFTSWVTGNFAGTAASPADLISENAALVMQLAGATFTPGTDRGLEQPPVSADEVGQHQSQISNALVAATIDRLFSADRKE